MLTAKLKDEYRLPIFSTHRQDFIKGEWRIVDDEDWTQQHYSDYLDFEQMDDAPEKVVEVIEVAMTREEILAMSVPQLRSLCLKQSLILKANTSKVELQNMLLEHFGLE